MHDHERVRCRPPGLTSVSRWIWSHRSGRKVLAALVLAFTLPPLAFTPLVERFTTASGGVMPFDNQFVLTPASMAEQLASWGPDAFVVYRWFAAVDFVFPPVFGFSLALAWAWLLSKAPGDVGERVAARGWLALGFASALFDWLENIGNLLVIHSWPEPSAAVWLALAGKYAKFGALVFELLATFAVIGYVVRARRRGRALH